MSTEIIKWIQWFRVTFKWDQAPIDVDDVLGKKIQDQLRNNSWIEVNWGMYNPFQVLSVLPIQLNGSAIELLKQEPEDIKKKAKEIIAKFERDNKKTASLAVIENAIKMAKWTFVPIDVKDYDEFNPNKQGIKIAKSTIKTQGKDLDNKK